MGKNKEDALRKFRSPEAQQTVLEEDALQVVMDEMLTWTENNRRDGTLQFYKGHAQQFIDFLKENKKANIACDQLTVDPVGQKYSADLKTPCFPSSSNRIARQTQPTRPATNSTHFVHFRK